MPLRKLLVFLGFYTWDELALRIRALRGIDLSRPAATLAEARDRAKENKDFSQVDALKSALTEAGVEVRMTKQGVELIPGPDYDAAKLEGLL